MSSQFAEFLTSQKLADVAETPEAEAARIAENRRVREAKEARRAARAAPAPVAASELAEGQIHARFAGRCACCCGRIPVGAVLARHVVSNNWVHAGCASEQSPLARNY